MSQQTEVKACPICGVRVIHQCFHDDREVKPVAMPAWRAVEKLTDTIGMLQLRIDDLIEERDRVKNL